MPFVSVSVVLAFLLYVQDRGGALVRVGPEEAAPWALAGLVGVFYVAPAGLLSLGIPQCLSVRRTLDEILRCVFALRGRWHVQSS